MRLADRVSHGWRRAALLFHFSRSPLRGSDLRVRRLPHGPTKEVGLDGPLDLVVSDWSMFKDVLFATFRAEQAAGQPRIERVLVVFSSCALEVPLTRSGEFDVAIPVPASHITADVGLAFELDLVGAKARHDRRVHEISRAQLAEEVGAAARGEALIPDGRDALDVGLRARPHFKFREVRFQIHRQRGAQRAEARVHFAADGAAARAVLAFLGK